MSTEQDSVAKKKTNRAFYELTVKERDYERTRSDRFERERDELLREIRTVHASKAAAADSPCICKWCSESTP